MATSKGPGAKNKTAKKTAAKTTAKKGTVTRRTPKKPGSAAKTRRGKPPGSRGTESLDRAALERRIVKLTSILDVAKALTAERDLDRLLEMILNEAVRVIDADRCTLWIVDQDRQEIWTKVAQGLEGKAMIRIPIGLGIAGQVAQSGETINIPDAYADPRFNRQVDRDTGYHTRNILGVAMFSTTGEVTGVLQALNKKDPDVDHFTAEDEELLLALGANAAAAIENAILYEEIDRLFEGFVKASVIAIESRDPTTSGHSERVAILTTGMAERLSRLDTGPYRGVEFSYDDMREIRYAALLHDFGKVGVREHVLTKAMKLYPGAIEVIETRFAALQAQRENDFLRSLVKSMRDGHSIDPAIEAAMHRDLEELHAILEFIRKCNQPTVLESGGFEKLREISRLAVMVEGSSIPVLSELDLQRLAIPRGSLDAEERLEIESHVTHTFRFLAQIPWTRTLRRIPEIAYAHHEKLDGAGYPRQLHAEQIPVQSRMMTIADIYDALTASDRPYKKAVPHTKAVDILEQEAKMNRVDRELLDVFIQGKVYEALPNLRLE